MIKILEHFLCLLFDDKIRHSPSHLGNDPLFDLLESHEAVTVRVSLSLEDFPLTAHPVRLGVAHLALKMLGSGSDWDSPSYRVDVSDVLRLTDPSVLVLVHVLQGLQHHDVHHVGVVLRVEEGLEFYLVEKTVPVSICLLPPPLVPLHHRPELSSVK